MPTTSGKNPKPNRAKFASGEKVAHKGKIYDFGYIGRRGLAVIYEEGERNMQESIAVDFAELTFPSTLRTRESKLAAVSDRSEDDLTDCRPLGRSLRKK